MKFKSMLGMAAALSMVAMPTLASAAPVAPAASLSSSSSVRTGAASHKSSQLSGTGEVVGALIGAGIIALIVIAATQKDNGPRATSP